MSLRKEDLMDAMDQGDLREQVASSEFKPLRRRGKRL